VPISLFAPYFRPTDPARREELGLCLEKNRQNASIAHVYLMVDDGAEIALEDGRVTVIRMDHRPTYQDWTQLTEAYCPDHISVLANADIYFDDTLNALETVFEHDPTGFVALSRHELEDDQPVLHPDPHWSQDVWAYAPAHACNPDRDRCLNFPLGTPRCDNKVAYTFAIYGHTLYNPCRHVRSIHVHDTGIRTYDKKGDMRIVGGMAMVHPGDGLTDSARLDIEMWPVRTDKFPSVRLNSTLEKWAQERGTQTPVRHAPDCTKRALPVTRIEGSPNADRRSGGLYRDRNVAGYDAHWQYPAITEQHAFNQIRRLAQRGGKVAYLGFPWATLVDVTNHNKSDMDRLSELKNGLARAADALRSYDRIVTVCQHIHMLEFVALFEESGVTDVFWAHATHDRICFGADRSMAIHPFPLYPVQVSDSVAIPLQTRQYLFSFVGARGTDLYLTRSRTYVLEELGDDPRGYVRDRESWHYNKIVYDRQVFNKTGTDENSVDMQASAEFRHIMEQTRFALCPSGTGPNSIRLWEAIANGAVPVVLSDNYKAPGSQLIWEQGVVQCAEDRASVRALPERLEALGSDLDTLRRRQAALTLIKARYGRANFVSDILSLMSA